MSIRTTLNENPIATTIVVTVIAALACLVIIWRIAGGDGGGGEAAHYYYDRNTGKVFVRESETSPMAAPSGETPDGQPAGVRAWIFACGQCQGSYEGMTPVEIAETGAELVYLTRQRAIDTRNDVTVKQTAVSKPGSDRWVSAGRPEAMRMMQYSGNCPKGKTVQRCRP